MPRNNGADWLKWGAIFAMVIDHLKWIDPQNPWAIPTEALGRAAFPWFALLAGWNLAFHTRNPWNFSGRVLLAGIGLEALKTLLLPGENTQSSSFITLGIGLFLATSFQPKNWRKGSQAQKGWSSLLAFLAIILAQGKPEYGLAGLALVSACALTPPKRLTSISLTGFLCLLCNTNPFWAVLATIFFLLGVKILNHPPQKPCPLPNSKWLYAALPLSYLPAWLYHLAAR